MALENLKSIFSDADITFQKTSNVIDSAPDIDTGATQGVDFFDGQTSAYYPPLETPIQGFIQNFNTGGYTYADGDVGNSTFIGVNSSLNQIIEFDNKPQLGVEGGPYEGIQNTRYTFDNIFRRGLGFVTDVFQSPLFTSPQDGGFFPGDPALLDAAEDYVGQVQVGKQIVDSINQRTFGLDAVNNLFGPITLGIFPPSIGIRKRVDTYEEQLFEGKKGAAGRKPVQDDADEKFAEEYRGNAFQVLGKNVSPFDSTNTYLGKNGFLGEDSTGAPNLKYSNILYEISPGGPNEGGSIYQPPNTPSAIGNVHQVLGKNINPVDNSSRRTIDDGETTMDAKNVIGPYDTYKPFDLPNSIHISNLDDTHLYKSVYTTGAFKGTQFATKDFAFLDPVQFRSGMKISLDTDKLEAYGHIVTHNLKKAANKVKSTVSKLIDKIDGGRNIPGISAIIDNAKKKKFSLSNLKLTGGKFNGPTIDRDKLKSFSFRSPDTLKHWGSKLTTNKWGSLSLGSIGRFGPTRFSENERVSRFAKGIGSSFRWAGSQLGDFGDFVSDTFGGIGKIAGDALGTVGSWGSTALGGLKRGIDFVRKEFPKYNPIKFEIIEIPKLQILNNPLNSITSGVTANSSGGVPVGRKESIDALTDLRQEMKKPFGVGRQLQVSGFLINFYHSKNDTPTVNKRDALADFITNQQTQSPIQDSGANKVQFAKPGNKYNARANDGKGNSPLVTDDENRTKWYDENTPNTVMSKPKSNTDGTVSKISNTVGIPTPGTNEKSDREYQVNKPYGAYKDIGTDKYPDSTRYYPSKMGGKDKSDGMTFADIRNGITLNDAYGELGTNPVEDSDNGYPFYIKDLRTSAYIIFRAYIQNITDSIQSDWNETNYIGRSESVYTYSKASRTVNFSLKLFAQSPIELNAIYEKMNALNTLCYPSYARDNNLNGKIRMIPPLASLRIGEFIGGMKFNQVGLIDSLEYTVPDDTIWEFRKGQRVPKHLEVTITFKVIHSEGNNSFPPNSDTKFYGYNDLGNNPLTAAATENIPIDLDTNQVTN